MTPTFIPPQRYQPAAMPDRVRSDHNHDNPRPLVIGRRSGIPLKHEVFLGFGWSLNRGNPIVR